MSDDNNWKEKKILNRTYSSYKSGSTTTVVTYGNIEYTIVTNSGNYTELQNGNYYGLQFNAGFNGTFEINTYKGNDYKFGVLAVGGGGDSKYYGNLDEYSGGSGGGIFYNNNLYIDDINSTIQIYSNAVYNLSVGNPTEQTAYGANYLTCYPGQSSTASNEAGKVTPLSYSYSNTSTPPVPPNPNPPYYGTVYYLGSSSNSVYTGGNGGSGCDAGQNSSIISVNVPCSTSPTYYVGGGGGGDYYDGFDYNCIGLGGHGYGGASGNTIGTQYGGAYGGGGAGGFIGGPGVFVIWWYV